jgi:hypothetical protein
MYKVQCSSMISIRTVINVSCTLHPQSVVSLLACAQRAVFHITVNCSVKQSRDSLIMNCLLHARSPYCTQAHTLVLRSVISRTTISARFTTIAWCPIYAPAQTCHASNSVTTQAYQFPSSSLARRHYVGDDISTFECNQYSTQPQGVSVK